MSNVIQLGSARGLTGRGEAAISAMFAAQRRARGDVFWLKENAEWLGILASTDRSQADSVLAVYEAFYRSIPAQMAFFPQYYRFFLSICLDLEDLGMPGDQGVVLCRSAARQQLAAAELSDLQRAEARRLLARRGADCAALGLDQRLRAFIGRPATFALPNKKAAYELTHIVYYLSEYGAKNPGLCDAALTSLRYAGILAYLDQNADLLAEICVALRFAGQEPPASWEAFVLAQYRGCRVIPASQGGHPDGYHAYLVTGWLARITGQAAFQEAILPGPVDIRMPQPPGGALRSLSELLYDLGAKRSGDWSHMRRVVLAHCPHAVCHVLEEAERDAAFEPFFEHFARASGM